jgi:hypothetical protein
LRKLIEKSYFVTATEVDAKTKGIDLCGAPLHYFEGNFMVTGLFESKKTGKLIIELASTTDGEKTRVFADAITKIDGMTPERFAENYMVAPDGSDIKLTGLRRGRRPKNWKPECIS